MKPKATLTSLTVVWRLALAVGVGVLLLGLSLNAQQTTAVLPMHEKLEDGAEFRWLSKKVLGSSIVKYSSRIYDRWQTE